MKNRKSKQKNYRKLQKEKNKKQQKIKDNNWWKSETKKEKISLLKYAVEKNL